VRKFFFPTALFRASLYKNLHELASTFDATNPGKFLVEVSCTCVRGITDASTAPKSRVATSVFDVFNLSEITARSVTARPTHTD